MPEPFAFLRSELTRPAQASCTLLEETPALRAQQARRYSTRYSAGQGPPRPGTGRFDAVPYPRLETCGEFDRPQRRWRRNKNIREILPRVKYNCSVTFPAVSGYRLRGARQNSQKTSGEGTPLGGGSVCCARQPLRCISRGLLRPVLSVSA